jgi:hypothetical protein
VENFRYLKCCFKYFPFKDLQAFGESKTGRRLAQCDFRSKKNPQARKIFFDCLNPQYFKAVLIFIFGGQNDNSTVLKHRYHIPKWEALNLLTAQKWFGYRRFLDRIRARS